MQGYIGLKGKELARKIFNNWKTLTTGRKSFADAASPTGE